MLLLSLAYHSLKNRLLPLVVSREVHQQLREALEANPDLRVSVNIEAQTFTWPGGPVASFPIDAFAKHCLLAGVDEIGYVQQHEEQIQAYEATRFATLNTLAG